MHFWLWGRLFLEMSYGTGKGGNTPKHISLCLKISLPTASINQVSIQKDTHQVFLYGRRAVMSGVVVGCFRLQLF